MDLLGALVLSWCCWNMGVWMITFGVRGWLNWRLIPVAGTVTKVERDSSGRPLLVIEYRFGAATHQCRVPQRAGRPGDTIPLLVDPSAPEIALIRGSEASNLYGDMLLCALGALIGVAGTAPLVSLVADR